MRDAMEARMWAEHGHAFSTALAGILSAAWTAFERLHAIEYDAPWQQEAGPAGPKRA